MPQKVHLDPDNIILFVITSAVNILNLNLLQFLRCCYKLQLQIRKVAKTNQIKHAAAAAAAGG